VPADRADGRGQHQTTTPSDITGDLSVFDRFATWSSGFVSRAWFFVMCVLLVMLWAPSILLLGSIDTWS
jgi:hypothetical protein